MSLQRVFEAARKIGSPVIMTDVSGRDPLVILPLEQFEAFMAEGEVEKQHVSYERVEEHKKDTTIHPVVGLTSPIAPEKAQATVIHPEMPVEAQDIALEERFYLEPLDDKDVA